jgi:uncharacterized protein
VPLYFLDTSALVKLYVREEGTEAMLELARPQSGNEFGLLTLAAVEVRSAVRRRERMGDIDDGTASEILMLFESHLENRFIRQPLTEAVIEHGSKLVDRYFLRAYDAIQLSACLALASSRGECTFACSDQSLLKAAQAEGLSTFDPTTARPG